MNEMKNGGASLEIWNVTWSGNGSGFWGEKRSQMRTCQDPFSCNSDQHENLSL